MTKKAQNPQSCLGAVMPSFLTHPYTQVVCQNKGELLYVLAWALGKINDNCIDYTNASTDG